MKRRSKEIIAFILTFTILISATLYLGYMYMPVREDYGATWNMYTKEPENTIDIMFVGSSLAYCDIIPAKIYEETGLTSYIIGAPNMNAGIAYYYLKEALKTQDPQLVMLEATTFCFSDITKEDSKINIGYMPFSLNRLEATFKVAQPSERLGLLFPLYNYHSRWSDYSANAIFSPRPDSKTDINAGYTYLNTATEQEEPLARDYDIEDNVFNENMDYLDKIIKLCEKENIKLELFMVPSCEYVSEELTEKIRKNAKNIPLTRFNDNFEELDLELETDFHDTLHLNFKGAVKYTNIISSHITENYEITPSSHNTDLWEERATYFNTTLKEFELQQ